MDIKTKELFYDFVVVGGGLSGICAAIAAARGGVKTALVHDRPVLGGNASSEIRMHICGADSHGQRDNARETGIVEEILLENKYRNPHNGYPIFDAILWEKTYGQENLDLYLNTHMTDVTMDKSNSSRIHSIKARQLTNETDLIVHGKQFADTTGDGTLSYLAGASYMSGREAKSTFNESHAPEVADQVCMGNTLLFKSVDIGKSTPYIKPSWANTYAEEDLVHRDHGATGYNYWWIELGGDELDTISDNEIIRNELLKATYGVWDHIKNGGDHQADNYVLDWMGFLPGKRESRRVIGDYVLNENDLANTITFDDAVAFGGWPMDMHVPGGLKAKLEPTDFIKVPDIYQIPYRSLYSKDINNLFIGGRIISASHMAFGSTRVMATCGIIGQAIGTAARFLNKKEDSPKDLLDNISAVQQALLKDDAYIPGLPYKDISDKAKSMTIIASSENEETHANNIVNGYQRTVGSTLNHWESKNEENPWISLESDSPILVNEIQLKFDSNLTEEIRMSMFDQHIPGQMETLPETLVKDYTIDFMLNNKRIDQLQINENHYRLNRHTLSKQLTIDKICITCNETHGSQSFRLFECSLY